MTAPHVVGVIPARIASVRLPAKPLADICGKPMIQHVYEAARQAQSLSEVLVATDDEGIASVVAQFGGTPVLTPPECPSGTDRIAAALRGRRAHAVVNIQGDEPLMNPATIDRCVDALLSDPTAAVSTPMVAFPEGIEPEEPAVVKAVADARGYALYFSRSVIPNISRADQPHLARRALRKHLGLYAYRREALETFVLMPPSRLELLEKLEQLRFLEAGFPIRLVEVTHDAVSVDTPEDLDRVRTLMAARI